MAHAFIGRSTPIPIERKQDSLGIGRQALDIWWADSTTAKRKALEAERQAEETDAERSKREVPLFFFAVFEHDKDENWVDSKWFK